jgi:hypothetical protein
MFSFNLARHASAGLIFAAGLLVVAQTGAGLLKSYNDTRESYRKYQQEFETERQQASQKIANNCQIIGPINPAFRDCIAKGVLAYQEKYNSEQDLRAQQDMAYWAMALFFLSVVSAIIGFVGLVALFISLKQTRQAISLDKEVGHAQVRAYLSVRPSEEIQVFGVGKVTQAESMEGKLPRIKFATSLL